MTFSIYSHPIFTNTLPRRAMQAMHFGTSGSTGAHEKLADDAPTDSYTPVSPDSSEPLSPNIQTLQATVQANLNQLVIGQTMLIPHPGSLYDILVAKGAGLLEAKKYIEQANGAYGLLITRDNQTQWVVAPLTGVKSIVVTQNHQSSPALLPNQPNKNAAKINREKPFTVACEGPKWDCTLSFQSVKP